MFLTRRGLLLPNKFKDIELIKKQFTVTASINPEFDFSDGPVSFSVYQETDDHLILPRHFTNSKFKKITNQIKIENKEDIQKMDIQERINLKIENKEEIQNLNIQERINLNNLI
jgi:hypothetical protein